MSLLLTFVRSELWQLLINTNLGFYKVLIITNSCLSGAAFLAFFNQKCNWQLFTRRGPFSRNVEVFVFCVGFLILQKLEKMLLIFTFPDKQLDFSQKRLACLLPSRPQLRAFLLEGNFSAKLHRYPCVRILRGCKCDKRYQYLQDPVFKLVILWNYQLDFFHQMLSWQVSTWIRLFIGKIVDFDSLRRRPGGPKRM